MSVEPADDQAQPEADHRTRVYRYGAPTRGGARALHLPEGAIQQLLKAHRFSNKLVELALNHDTEVAAVWSGYPEVATAEAALATAEAAVVEATRIVQREKVRQRTRAVKGPAVEALREAQALTRAARTQRKAAIVSIRQDPAIREEIKGKLAEVDQAYRDVKKATRQAYAAEGLYWGTYNDVIAHAQTADRRVREARKKGPAQRRFSRWDGSGALTVQLQRTAGRPARTPQLIASGEGPWRNMLTGPFDRVGRGVVMFRYGTGRENVAEIPVMIHRVIPEGADITGARLVAQRVAGHTAYSIHITARVPPPQPRQGGPIVAMHLGWRRDDEGRALRVATWRSDTDITVPERLRPTVTQDSAHSGRIILPGPLRDRMDEFDQVRSARDTALEEIKETFATWLDDHPQPATDERDALTGGDVRRWRSPGRFAVIALRWRSDPPKDGADIAAALETWRVSDRRAWEREAHGRRKVLGHRREIYRCAAAWIASVAGTLVVDRTDLPSVIRQGKRGDLPGAVEDRASSQRVDAAPGELRGTVLAAAIREGLTITEVDQAGVTLIHHPCGHRNPPDERWAASVTVVCDGCGRRFDQDANATIGLLARAVQSPPAP